MPPSGGQSSSYQKEEVVESFLELELKYDLLDLKPNGIPVWERIRWRALREVLKGVNIINQPHEYINTSWKSYHKAGKGLLKNIISKNPYMPTKCDIAFFGHPRRKLLDDGYWWDLYCDPIQNNIDYSTIHFEGPRGLQHKKPPKTDRIKYLDVLKYTAALKRKAGITDIKLDDRIKDTVEKAENNIKDKYSIKVHFNELIENELNKHFSEKSLYDKLLSIVSPEILVTVPGYGAETLLESASDSDITTIELQHGVITSSHLGYSYKGARDKKVFPDYLFIWGDFWSEGVEFPISDEKVIPIGYPFLSQQINKYSNVATKDAILFISQSTIGEELSKFALEVDKNDRVDSNIIYKLHPGEYNRWRQEYPWLVDSNIEVVDSSDPPLYKLFALAHTQVGVGSTALFEGLAFNLNTYIYDLPGREVFNPLIEEGAVTSVKSTDRLAKDYKNNSIKFQRNRFFCSNPIHNFKKQIHKILLRDDLT